MSADLLPKIEGCFVIMMSARAFERAGFPKLKEMDLVDGKKRPSLWAPGDLLGLKFMPFTSLELE